MCTGGSTGVGKGYIQGSYGHTPGLGIGQVPVYTAIWPIYGHIRDTLYTGVASMPYRGGYRYSTGWAVYVLYGTVYDTVWAYTPYIQPYRGTVGQG